jgi:tRNA dimethylallyltransferase
MNASSMQKILIICGPTATGKTSLAVALAKKFSGELVNADSRQLYIGLDSISGKDKDQLQDIPMWLYDVVPVDKEFSISQFQIESKKVITDITKRKHIPIVIGGNGFYLSVFDKTIDTLHIPQNKTLRNELYVKSVEALQQQLQTIDSSRWLQMNNSDRHNPRRLVRAIEVALYQAYQPSPIVVPAYDILWIGLKFSSGVLHHKIEDRVRRRWETGALKEGKKYMYLPKSLPASTTLGLDQIRKFLLGDISKQEAQTQWAAKEYAYAKRQMTWFANNKQIHWFDIENSGYTSDIEKLVTAWYTTSSYAN